MYIKIHVYRTYNNGRSQDIVEARSSSPNNRRGIIVTPGGGGAEGVRVIFPSAHP